MMTTVPEFMERATAAINDVALACSHEPDQIAERLLGKLSVNLRAGWRQAFPWLRPDDIDTAVDDVIARARLRRREIEHEPAGVA
jgi:hypothetical protein